VGHADGTDAYIVTSPDGITWTEQANTYNKELRGICFANSVFVAVGKDVSASSYIIVSVDGENWSPKYNPEDEDLYSVCYGDGRFVIVGDVKAASDVYILTSLFTGV